MKSVEVEIKGISPLLMNRFTEAAQAQASSGVSRRHAERDEASLDAEGRLYVLDGKPYVPSEWVRQSLVGAAGYHKIGRRSAATAVAAGVLVAPEVLTLDPGSWIVDSRPVTIPATKGRILRHRPKFEDWKLEFTIQYDDTILDGNLVRAVVDDAGSKVGIGDYRPARRGPYGRFAVTNWNA